MTTFFRERYVTSWTKTKTYPRKGIIYRKIKHIIADHHPDIEIATWIGNHLFERVADVWMTDVFDDEDGAYHSMYSNTEQS